MSRFIKPSIDETIYLWSDKAKIVASGTQNIEYRWSIPELSLNNWGKLQMIGREYKTQSKSTTPIITSISNTSVLVATKGYVDTRKAGNAILDVSCWNYLAPFNVKPPLLLPPQVIDNITLIFDDDIQEAKEPYDRGIPNTSQFVIILRITEDPSDMPVVEWGSTNAVNVRQMQIPTYNNWN